MKISFPDAINLPGSKYPGISENSSQDVKFSDLLNNAIEKVDELQKKADSSAIALATGDINNMHDVMIDMQQAEMALQFTIQVRNKILEAYQEIMRMQV